MIESNTPQSQQWITKEIEISSFKGYIKYKSTEDDEGYTFTHIVYCIIDDETNKTFAGIGNDWEEVSKRIQEQVIEYQAHPNNDD